MATVDQVARLRLLTDLPDDVTPYTDEYLSGLIDAYGMDAAASLLWKEKAAKYAGMVDMTESGSSRKLSQLREAALEMANGFEPEPKTSGSFTWPIERV